MTRQKIRIVLISLLGIILVASSTFIYKTIANRSLQKSRNEAVKTVVNELLTCPNQELITLYNEMFKQLESESDQEQEGTSSSKIYSLDSSKLEDKLRNIYQPYFTVKGYETFEARFFTSYYIYSTTLGHQTTVNEIDITQSETIPTNYSFTAYVRHSRESEEWKEFEIMGSIQMDHKENKLTYIQIINDELYQELVR